jgi:formate dehydrogenase major subunit
MKALVTDRVGRGVAFMPFHFGGLVGRRRHAQSLPQRHRSRSARRERELVTTYGYDPVTDMQETKCTLCQIQAA